MGAEHIHLPKAPILEALIDIKVDPTIADGDYAQKLEAFQKRVAAKFTKVQEIQRWDSHVVVGSNAAPSMQTQERKRLRLDSSDLFTVLQVDRAGITHSRLKPYTSWGDFSADFLEVWRSYSDIFAPKSVVAISLQYINRFEFQDNLVALPEYFHTGPRVGPQINLPFAAYTMQFTLPNPAIGATCLVTQVAQPNPAAPGPTVIFDINTNKQGTFVPNEETLKKHLEDLHKFKNDIFFGSITDKMIGLYK